MQFHAASIGSAVPRDNFDAVTQSVFDSAVNLRLVNEDRLLTLLISDHYELPQGIRISTRDIPLRSLTPGGRAAARGGVLRFESSDLRVDMRGAFVWKCRVPQLNVDMETLCTQQAWSAAWTLLNRQQRDGKAEIVAEDLFRVGAGSALGRRISQPVMDLIASTEKFDSGGAVLAAEKMIGLGPGVTPSGDDILIGFLAGLWGKAGKDQAQSSFIHSFGGALLQTARQTNEISRTYLYHAVHGQFSSSLSNLVEAIAICGDVEQAAKAAARVGHSSGMDSMTGLLAGLDVWKNEPIPALKQEVR